MKKSLNKCKDLLVKGMVVAVFSAFATGGFAQSASITADPQLGTPSFVNEVGFAVNANAITADEIISLKIPVNNNNNGKIIPAGSCKIKVGLGSKLMLDPVFNINNAALSNYFKWTSSTNGGQVELVGELINPLPANVTDVNVTFKVKASAEGTSTVTANFLITNHNTAAVLSDENGANNSSSVAYKVISKGAQVPVGEASNLTIYPNPAKDVKEVAIFAANGEFTGTYAVSMYDITGKLVNTVSMKLNAVNKFNYSLGNIAAGNYLIKILKPDMKKPYLLKLEKM